MWIDRSIIYTSDVWKKYKNVFLGFEACLVGSRGNRTHGSTTIDGRTGGFTVEGRWSGW